MNCSKKETVCEQQPAAVKTSIYGCCPREEFLALVSLTLQLSNDGKIATITAVFSGGNNTLNLTNIKLIGSSSTGELNQPGGNPVVPPTFPITGVIPFSLTGVLSSSNPNTVIFTLPPGTPLLSPRPVSVLITALDICRPDKNCIVTRPIQPGVILQITMAPNGNIDTVTFSPPKILINTRFITCVMAQFSNCSAHPVKISVSFPKHLRYIMVSENSHVPFYPMGCSSLLLAPKSQMTAIATIASVRKNLIVNVTSEILNPCSPAVTIEKESVQVISCCDCHDM